jgi:protein TonB
MNPFFSRNNNLDEVVFENRNKEYGAYAMRKSYDSNLLKASASSFGFLIICMGTFYVLGLFPKELPPMPLPPQIIPDETKIHDIVVIPDPVTDLPAAGARNTHPNVFRIVSDHLVTQVQPTIPSDPVLPHNPNGTEGGTVGGETGGVQGGTVINPGTIPPPEPSAFETYVSEMPAFPGGADAMADYLSKHMNYPAIARENGIEGKGESGLVVTTKRCGWLPECQNGVWANTTGMRRW